MNLYELSTEYQHLLDKEELSDEEIEIVRSLENNIEDACISRSKYIRNREAELSAVNDAIKSMQERAKTLQKRIERSEDFLLGIMQQTGLTKITKSPLFVIQTKRCPPSVMVEDEALVPEDFFKIKVTETKSLDKLLVKSHIEKGEAVPGCQLVSKLKIDIK